MSDTFGCQETTILGEKTMTFDRESCGDSRERLTNLMPVFKKQREFYDTSKIFIGLSHLPLMFMPSAFTEKVIAKMLPQVIFAGHEHKSMIVSTDALLREDYHIIPINPDNNKVFEYTLGVTDMYEILIPTCSYRMGTKKIGYGYAILEKNNLRFTVLWSPSRFDQLTSYFVVFVCFIMSMPLYLCFCRKKC
ncbi:uncharacterized protein LOC109606279 [Aethina tumida]|uniref:uncharacterized protein LOC109606279 n=1 Tax=Aethina tumida TaxID=116153 RepID=UPI002147937C|nr:uncharacterized protein LOC109606279 [Aethina tumida]